MVGEGVVRDGGEPVRRDVLRNRSAILAAAADVLAADPAASVAEVAARAGLGRATLYRHFPNRESLRDAIREEALAQAAAALSGVDLTRGSARDGIRRAAEVLIPLGMRFRILLADGVDDDAAFVAARAAVLRPVLELVTRGAAEGELRADVAPVWFPLVLTALLMSAVRSASTGVVSVQEAARLVSLTLFDGLGSPS